EYVIAFLHAFELWVSFSHHQRWLSIFSRFTSCLPQRGGCFRVPHGDRPLQQPHRPIPCARCVAAMFSEPNWHWRVPPVWLQKEMPFWISRPTKTAVSDSPNICAVPFSLVFVMTSIPAVFGFCLQQRKVKARMGAHTSIRR